LQCAIASEVLIEESAAECEDVPAGLDGQMEQSINQLRKLENDWWNWRILCWVRDALLFTWVIGAVLMIADDGNGKTFGFWLLWLGLAGWPTIMVLGWRWQERAKDIEKQYRPYIRGWLSWQAAGWVVLGIAIVLYLRSFVTPWVILFNHRGGENSAELAEGRLIVVTYTDATPPGITNFGQLAGGEVYLPWQSLSLQINMAGSALRGQTIIRHRDGGLLKCQYAVVPLVALLPIVLVWPIAWGARIRAIERRRKGNRCPNCGYDLRESPQLCPECGQAVMRLIDEGVDQFEEGQITHGHL
jgi:hypothetical protein